jgi:hypothetical protein
MKSKISLIAILSAALVWGSACQKSKSCAGSGCPMKTFTLYNSIHFTNTPGLSNFFVHDFELIYSSHLVSANPNLAKDVIPNADSILAQAEMSAKTPSMPVSLDIESWSYSSGHLDSTIGRFLEVIRLFKQANAASKVGFYGVVPHDAYSWPNIEPLGGSNYMKWEQLNDSLAPIANAVDIFFPSFYTFDNDTLSWKNFVTATLSEVQKYGRNIPVLAYLWPQYHDGTANQFEFVDTAVWRYELETLYALTDGIVIWTGSKGPNGTTVSWDPNMAWWQTTQAFIQEHQIH